MISPLLFLGLTLLVTALSITLDLIFRRRFRHQLQRLAVELKMAYSPYDRFGFADRVAERFPIPGSAALRIIDLLYASEADGYRYLFSAEYTSGVIRSKRRLLRAATFREPKGRTDIAGWSPILLGSEELPLIEQYRALAARNVSGVEAASIPTATESA